MVLPASSLPTPTALLPSPSSARSIFGPGAGGDMDEVIERYSSSYIGQLMEARRQEELARMGLDPDADPNAWTLEEASEQTDAALAKLATVNPEQAMELQEMRVNAEEEADEDVDPTGPIDIAKAVLGGLGKGLMGMLELLTRPARVIPELIVDQEDPWWEDVGQALTGKTHTTWDDVLEKWGMEEGWLRAGLGFVGDVATDPLTYVGLGMLGRGRAAASALSGKTVAASVLKESPERVNSVVADLINNAGTREQAVKVFGERVGLQSTDEYAEGIVHMLTQSGMDPTAAGGLAANWLTGANRAFVQRAIDHGDTAMRYIETVGLHNAPERMPIWKMGAQMGDEPTDWVLKENVLRNLDAVREMGTGWGKKAAYQRGMLAAAARGGPRLRGRLPVPFLKYRWISPSIPGLERMSFQPLRRMMVGQGGMVRLARAIGKGSIDPDTGAMALRAWQTYGWSAAARQFPELQNLGRFGGNMTARLSEQLGRLTLPITPHAASLRTGGIAGLMMRNTAAQGKGFMRQFTAAVSRHIEYEVDPATGQRVPKRPIEGGKVNEGIYKHLAKNGKATPADYDRYWEFDHLVPDGQRAWQDPDSGAIQYIPERLDTPEKLDTHWREEVFSNIERESEMGFIDATQAQARMASEMERLQRAKQLLREVQENGEYEHLMRLRSSKHQVLDELYRNGIRTLDSATDYEGAEMLRPGAEARAWARGSRTEGQTFYAEVAEETEALSALDLGTTQMQKHVGYDFGQEGAGYGIHGASTAPGRHSSVKLAFAIENPVPTGEWEDIRRGAQQLTAESFSEAEEAAMKAGIVLDGTPEQRRALVEEWLASAAAQGRGFDGRIYRDADGVTRAVAFDHSKAKVLHENAPRAMKNRNYTPHMYSDEADEIIGNKMRQQGIESRELPRRLHDVRMRRPRHFDDLDPRRAEVEEARWLRDEMGFDIDVEAVEAGTFRLFERNVIRNHEKYVDMGGAEVMAHIAGDLESRLRVFGANRDPLLGGLMDRSVWRYPEGAAPEVLTKLIETSDDVARSVNRHREELKAAEVQRLKVARRLSDNLVQLRHLVDGPLGANLDRVAGGDELREFIVSAGQRSRSLQEELRAAGKRGAVGRPASAIRGDIAALREDMTRMRELARKGPGARKTGRAAAIRHATQLPLEELEDLDRALRHGADMVSEQNKLTYNLRAEVARARPAMMEKTERNAFGFTEVQIPGRKDTVYMAPFLASEFNHMLGRFKDINAIRRLWRKQFLPRWKTWATVMSPGFHVRNNVGAFFNNLLGGVEMEDYIHAFRLTRVARNARLGVAKKPIPRSMVKKLGLQGVFGSQDITYNELWKHINDVGVGSVSARHVMDLSQAAEASVSGAVGAGMRGGQRVRGVTAKRRGPLGAGVDFWQRGGQRAATTTENLHRYAMYMAGMRITGDPSAARLMTMMRHGDYADLNDWEMGLVRDVVPFYKWFRTNLPYQIHNMFENPVWAVSAMKLRDAFWHAQGMEPAEARAALPGWMQSEFLIPLPEEEHEGLGGENDPLSLMVLDLPLSDLMMGYNEFVSMGLPIVRPVMEALGGKVGFTGQELKGEYIPVANTALGNALSPVLGPLADMGVPFIKRDAEGNLTMTDKFAHVLTAVPIWSRFRNWLVGDEDRADRRMAVFWSFLGGVGNWEANEKLLTSAEREFYYREVAPVIAQLRSLKVPLPNKDELSAAAYWAVGLQPPPEEPTAAAQEAGPTAALFGG